MNAKIRMKEMLADLMKVCDEAHEFVGRRIHYDTHADGMPWFFVSDREGLILATLEFKWIKTETIMAKRIKSGEKFMPFKVSIDVIQDNVGRHNFIILTKRSRDLYNAYAAIMNRLAETYG